MAERAPLTVITCCYNPDPQLLREALESVAGQTVLPVCLILVDDGSDPPLPMPEGDFPFPIRLVRHEENRKLATALNTGVAAAETELVAFVDADDRWLPEKIERQVALWRERGADLALIATRPHVLDAERDVVVDGGRGTGAALLDFAQVLRKERFTGWSTVLLSRARYLEAGGCNTALPKCQDWDFWLRATALGRPVALIERPLVVYRYDARSYAAAPVALEVFRHWRKASEEGTAPAVDPSELGRLSQHHLLNYAYRAIAAGSARDAMPALEECLREPHGSRRNRALARLARLAPGLFAAAVAYRKMATGRMAWRLRPRDPRWAR